MNKPTVVFDFDGVIHSYWSGWQGVDVIPDLPVPGIKELIEDLRTDHEIAVVSTRCSTTDGQRAILNYLQSNGIKVDCVLAEKSPAICYVDDRAICFRGQTEGFADKIRGFKSWVQS